MEWTMKLAWYTNKDFWAGVMFLVFGGLAIGIARAYPFGTTLRMGPGYFPTMLGGILICFGVIVLLKGLARPAPLQGHWSARSLMVLPLALIFFGVLIDRAGFVPALAGLVFVAAAAGREFRWGEVLLLTAALTLMSVAVFIWGLGLPYQLFTLF
jgi:hypothetical protein